MKKLLFICSMIAVSLTASAKSTEGTGECLAPMEDGRWLMSEG